MALRSRPNLVIDPNDLKALTGLLKGLSTDFIKRENHAIRALKRGSGAHASGDGGEGTTGQWPAVPVLPL